VSDLVSPHTRKTPLSNTTRSSASLTISTFTVGFLGPSVFNLTFGQAVAITWTLLLFGACCSAYLATFGKKHGLRALVNSRYTFGFYGSMVMSCLNILTEMIFGFQACIQGGQTLAVMSKGNLSTIGGIFIIGILSWFIATAGFKYVHYYERVAWVFPVIVSISRP
jgi:purine-cytosine permease-like protein